MIKSVLENVKYPLGVNYELINFMSGHSHYATIKRQKGLKDAAKGKIFSKMARAITIAVKAGGNTDPDANYKLRMAVDAARTVNMPKENIDRAINKAISEGDNIEEVFYEGFASGGVGVIVEAATDNRNRTAQEIKNIFEKGGGSLAGPGSVSFNFEPKGLIVIKRSEKSDEQILTLIDAGVEDFEETGDAIEVYVPADKLSEVKSSLEEKGFEISSFELVRKPKNLQNIDEVTSAQKVLKLLDSLEENEDVQKVYANINIPDEVLQKLED